MNIPGQVGYNVETLRQNLLEGITTLEEKQGVLHQQENGVYIQVLDEPGKQCLHLLFPDFRIILHRDFRGHWEGFIPRGKALYLKGLEEEKGETE